MEDSDEPLIKETPNHVYHFLKTEPGLNQRPPKRRRMTPAVAMPDLPPELQMMFSMTGAANMQPFITFK